MVQIPRSSVEYDYYLILSTAKRFGRSPIFTSSTKFSALYRIKFAMTPLPLPLHQNPALLRALQQPDVTVSPHLSMVLAFYDNVCFPLTVFIGVACYSMLIFGFATMCYPLSIFYYNFCYSVQI